MMPQLYRKKDLKREKREVKSNGVQVKAKKKVMRERDVQREEEARQSD